MSKKFLMVCAMIAIVAVALPGCKKNGDDGERGQPSDRSRTGEVSGTDMSAQYRSQLDQIEQGVNRLQSQTSALPPQAQQQWSQLQTKLNEQLQDARQKVDNLKNASADKRDQAQQDASQSLSQLRQTYQQATSIFQGGGAGISPGAIPGATPSGAGTAPSGTETPPSGAEPAPGGAGTTPGGAGTEQPGSSGGPPSGPPSGSASPSGETPAAPDQSQPGAAQ